MSPSLGNKKNVETVTDDNSANMEVGANLNVLRVLCFANNMNVSA